MLITKEWLRVFGTIPNKRQLACIGLSFPLQKGWIESVVGKEISAEQQRQFESLKGKSQHQCSIDLAKETHQFEAFYITTPDDKGGWTGRWGNEYRWYFPYRRGRK